MPVFTYEAMDAKGKPTKGTLEVANQSEALTRLKEMGYFPTKVVESDKDKDKDKDKAENGERFRLPFASPRARSLPLSLCSSLPCPRTHGWQIPERSVRRPT